MCFKKRYLKLAKKQSNILQNILQVYSIKMSVVSKERALISYSEKMFYLYNKNFLENVKISISV